jgi:hypothetical protein
MHTHPVPAAERGVSPAGTVIVTVVAPVVVPAPVLRTVTVWRTAWPGTADPMWTIETDRSAVGRTCSMSVVDAVS